MTVIDVMREMGVEITNDLSWEVGAHAREAWIAKTGESPELRLTTKTCGAGSHCIAQYPGWFKPTIIRIIEACQTERASQLDLFR